MEFPRRGVEGGRVMKWWLLLIFPGTLMGNPRGEYARGVLERERGGNGKEWFEKALADDPEAWPLVRTVVRERLSAGEVEPASSLYREFAERHRDRLEVQVGYADFLSEMFPRDEGAAQQAGKVLAEAREGFPQSIGVRRRLFRNFEGRGMREQAMEIFDEAEAKAGGSAAEALLAGELARTLFEGDDGAGTKRVDEVFERAMAEFPGNRQLARRASEHFRTTSRLGDAVRMLELHVAADPASLDLRTRLGVLLFAADRGEEGVKVLEEVVAIDPREGLAHQALAKYFRRVDRPDAARPHAAEALKLRGGDPEDFIALADEWLEAGEPRQARLLLEKGIFDHPDDEEMSVLLAVATQRDPETKSMAALRFREAESLSGNEGPAMRPEFQLAFAEHLIETGDGNSAESRIRAAIKAYPPEARRETAAALRKLAGLWEAEGRNEAAARSLRSRAEALDPEGSK